MRQGKELILATKAYTKENKWYEWYCLTQGTVLLLGTIALSLFCPYWSVRIPAAVLQGAVIVRLFVIYHDYQHHTIFQRSPLAGFIMKALGIFILAPESIWKRSHDFHHQQNSKLWTSSIGSYPVLTLSKFNSLDAKKQKKYLRTRHPLTILGGYLSMFLVGMCWQSFKSDQKRHRDSLFSMLFHLTYILVVYFFLGWQTVMVAILFPFIIAGAIGAYLFFVQHNFPDVQYQSNADWTYEKAALGSSSYMQMNRVMAWVTANIGYHHIHHLNAHIPFYRLPEVMRHFPELQHAGKTSWKWKDVKACIRLKVWDEEKKKMVGLD